MGVVHPGRGGPPSLARAEPAEGLEGAPCRAIARAAEIPSLVGVGPEGGQPAVTGTRALAPVRLWLSGSCCAEGHAADKRCVGGQEVDQMRASCHDRRDREEPRETRLPSPRCGRNGEKTEKPAATPEGSSLGGHIGWPVTTSSAGWCPPKSSLVHCTATGDWASTVQGAAAMEREETSSCPKARPCSFLGNTV